MHKNALLERMNLGLTIPSDGRKVECLVTGGLRLYNGAQLAVDATLVSPLTGSGKARPRAAHTNGVALEKARQDKETTYPELLRANRCKLIVVGMEVGGRWSAEAYDFLEQLAWHKASEVQPALQKTTALAWLRRWSAMISVAAMRSFADTLLHGTANYTDTGYTATPDLSCLLGEVAYEGELESSRLPLRA